MLPITHSTRISYDRNIKAVRSWFDTTTAQLANKTQQSPLDFAYKVLSENAADFAWQSGLPDLEYHADLTSGQAFSVRFTQVFKGIPVDGSEVLVNMYKDGRVYSIYNNYQYDIPPHLDPQNIKIQHARQSIELLNDLLKNYGGYTLKADPVLIVYKFSRDYNRPPKGETSQRKDFLSQIGAGTSNSMADISGHQKNPFFLVWDLRVLTRNPVHYWRILIDAYTGEVVNAIDLAQYFTGSGKVFDPNPIVTSGDTTLRHDSAAVTINNQSVPVPMDRLDAPDGDGKLHLDGSFVNISEREAPTVNEPVSSSGDFTFSYDDNNFLAAMCYYHIDRFQQYIQTDLGITNAANYSIPVDPQGLSSSDQSWYVSDLGTTGTGYIAFGGGTIPPSGLNPVPDAADAMVVLHEYGHAIQDNSNPGFDNPLDGTGEGFGDFLAAVYYDDKHTNPAATRGVMMSWDAEMGSGSWPGRLYNVDWLFDGPEYLNSFDNHIRGQLWCAAMFEIYRKLGGDSQYPWVRSGARDLIIRLHLMANFHVPAKKSTAVQMAQQVEAADGDLGGWRYANGLHKKVIYDTFRRRHLPGFDALPVDVYINDGRNGGYGSPTGNDLFTENLFADNYWSTQDLWVKTIPYASDSDQQAGGPGDHVEPPVGDTAYLYVKAKNRGTSDSGTVNLKAFHADPTIGLVWPNDWTPTDTPSLSVANIAAGGEYVFGPFPWTPAHVGHECVFAIAECDNDRAVTQNLLGSDLVAHADLVPFDNNIAQRNLNPTAAEGKMKRGFWVSNPFFEPSVVKLHFENTLPRGWSYATNIVNTDAVRLAPRERKWVEITINQASGEKVTDFTIPASVTVSGSINGKLIGGVGFYAAPPSAFPRAKHKPADTCSPLDPHDLFCLNIPWKDCSFKGKIELTLPASAECAEAFYGPGGIAGFLHRCIAYLRKLFHVSYHKHGAGAKYTVRFRSKR